VEQARLKKATNKRNAMRIKSLVITMATEVEIIDLMLIYLTTVFHLYNSVYNIKVVLND
jgi:hypothetical protein